MEKVIINKFGGEIMWTPELNKLLLNHIKEQKNSGNKIIVVCSALTKVTDTLINWVDEIVKSNSIKKIDILCDNLFEIHINHIKKILNNKKNILKLEEIISGELKQLKDSLKFILDFWYVDFVTSKIISFWEKLSTHIIKFYLEENNIEAKRFTWEELGIITDNNYGDANINYDLSKEKVKKNLENNKNIVNIIAWFTWIDNFWRTTILWRWGTDTTACFIWSVLKADKVILWKNVEWVLTSDPRIVENTNTIKILDYDEAEESWKVVCNKAITYLKNHNSPMEVAFIKNKNIFTKVCNKKDLSKKVKLLSYKKDCSLLKIKSERMTKSGFLYNISAIFEELNINMSFIRNTRDTMYISIDNNQKNLEKLFQNLEKICSLEKNNCSMINIIWNLNWDLAMEVNLQLKKISKNLQIWVFPHENCSRLEAIVDNNELEKILNHFHQIFINT